MSDNNQEIQRNAGQLIQMFQSGDLANALALAETLISQKPDVPIYHNIAGAIHTNAGNLTKAISSFKTSVKLDPDYAQAHNNLGNAYKAQDDLNAALASYQHAIKLNPDFEDALFNAALLHQDMGEPSNAAQLYERNLNLNPQSASAHRNLGHIRASEQKFEQALIHFEAALAADAQDPPTVNACGAVHQDLNDLETARKYFLQALDIDAGFAPALYNMGVLEQAENSHARALEYYQSVLALRPDDVQTLVNAGVANLEKGDADRAKDFFSKAIDVNARVGGAHYNFSQIHDYTKDDAHIRQLQTLFADLALPVSDKEQIGFALSKAFDDIDSTEQAFEIVKTANALHRDQNPYEISDDNALFEAIKIAFETAEKVTAPAVGDVTPVFIVGMPRSGTTLVEQILASHSQVHGAGEITSLQTALAPELTKGGQFAWSSGKPTLNLQRPDKVAASYQSALANLGATERTITDKLPLNFRWIGFILAAMPNAKILHIARHPTAVCWSNFRRRFSANGHQFAYDLGDLAAYFRLYQDLMKYWNKKLPGQILNISYEELTRAPEPTVKEMLQYCDLEWDAACLNFHNSSRIVKTASSLQVRQKIYTGSSESWKKYTPYLAPIIALQNGRYPE